MLIQAYGEYWTPDGVDWGSRGGGKGCLPGTARPSSAKSFRVDVWTATAVYVLWHDYAPVYIGKAGASRGLGPRMRDHLADRLGKRWDLFSWYSLSKPLRGGGMSTPGKRQVEPVDVLAAFEAFGQRLDLPLNRRVESIPSAIKVEQIAPKARDRFGELSAQIERLELQVASLRRKAR